MTMHRVGRTTIAAPRRGFGFARLGPSLMILMLLMIALVIAIGIALGLATADLAEASTGALSARPDGWISLGLGGLMIVALATLAHMVRSTIRLEDEATAKRRRARKGPFDF